MNTYNITLLSYADKNKRKKGLYEITQQKMISFFRENFPEVNNYLIYNSENHDYKKSDFYLKNKKLFSKKYHILNQKNRINAIYTYIQVYLLLESLKQIKNNDFLLWHDSNPEWYLFFDYKKTYYFKNHIKECLKNKGLLFWGHKNRSAEKLTSENLYKSFGLNYNDINKNCICNSWIFIQKNNFTLNFFEEVLKYIISDEYHKIRSNHFQDSCQDVYNIFLKKYKIDIYQSHFYKDKIILSTFLNRSEVKKINKKRKKI